jgi:cation-dependent mannose-6-phosphate receptor
MHVLPSLIALLSLSHYTTAASDDKKPAPKPCTIHSPTTGSFIDMRPLALSRDGAGSSSQSSTNESYHAKGYDYPYNFTLNFCDSVVEKLEDVNGVKERNWRNVSAFYKDSHDNVISIGQQNSELLFRGKKLLLNYTMGSPCPDLDEDGRPISRRAILDDDDDDDSRKGKKSTRRKTTLMTFACDTSPLLAGKPAISFLGTPDHCTYLFEVRSRHACGGTTTQHESGTLGPGGVFLVITGIALLVYLIGGIVYQRNVMHQRGWRQLPHYGMWAGIFSFVSVSFSSLPPI